MSKSGKVPIVAIVGRANVGKSSLFNSILHRREAIVAREAGTTRDSVTAKATYNNKDFWLVDTAGMKSPEDDFELTIQEQIAQAADSADVIVVTIEADAAITEEDRRVAKLALKSKKPVILAVNKSDKQKGAKTTDYQRLGIKEIILTSASQNHGIEELLKQVTSHTEKASIRVADDRIRVALLGRPNVGKSALFNSLSKKQQAIVAARAGTTRDINRNMIRYEGREIELLDTAGIRRSGKIERGIEKFSVMRTLQAIEEADICFLLMEVNELGVQLDQKIAGLVKDAGKGLVLVVTKWDDVNEKTPYTRDQMAARIKQEYVFVPWAPLIFTSSVSGQNVTKLFDLVLDIDKQRSKHLKTTELNKWLGNVVRKHPPAGLKSYTPKLQYIVQETNTTPSFKVFGANTRFIHWSYRRFMDREIRETFGFEGTPVVFWFIDKNRKEHKKKEEGIENRE